MTETPADHSEEPRTFRDQWEAMSADERRSYADPNRTCIERGCEEPAGTPWTPLWCADHDDARINRISASLADIAGSFNRG